MIVRFAVEPEALLLPRFDAPLRRAVHQRLLDLWRRVGLLVFDGTRFGDSALAAVVEQLPQDLRVRWQASLKQNRLMPLGEGFSGWAALESPEQLRAVADKIDLVCCEETRAQILGVPADQEAWACPDPRLEICRFDCIDQAAAFRRAQVLAEEDVPAGTRVDDLYQERFAVLAEHCQHVVIVDRYAWQRFHERTGGGRNSGLAWLLSRLDGCRRVHQVIVYSSIPDTYTVQQVSAWGAERFDLLRRGGIGELRVHLCSSKTFGTIAHDRYVRFNDAVCWLGSGLEAFEDRESHRAVGFNLEVRGAHVRDLEARLAAVSREWKFPERRR